MARELPIFPLPLVLFPGASLPLHIFEPRYRAMLADCLAADHRFGISYAPDVDTPPASVGSVAVIRATRQLPDGRSHILVSGDRRYELVGWVDRATPYRVATVRDLDDVPDASPALDELARELRGRFAHLLSVLQEVVGHGDESDQSVASTGDPATLSFHVCAAIAADAADLQDLLRTTSTSARMRRLLQLLDPLVQDAERRLAVHRVSEANGKSDRPPVVEVER